MKRFCPWLIPALVLPVAAKAPNYSALPDWAWSAVEAAAREAPPADVDAWVLLDSTEFAYTGSGEIQQRHRRVVRILEERGISQGVYHLVGLGGRAARIKSIKGWNVRPDGDLTKLERDQMITFSLDDYNTPVNIYSSTVTALSRVVKGSVVAFESQEVIRHPMGPVAVTGILEPYPVRTWECSLAKRGGWFTSLKDVELRLDTRNLESWTTPQSLTADTLRLTNLPARPQGEFYHPYLRDAEPCLYVAFIDGTLKGTPSSESWDSLAAWEASAFTAKVGRIEPLPLAGLAPKAGLEALSRWMAKALTYKAVYVTPERGWVPESSAEVYRRRYGDCKDNTSFLLGSLKALGQEGHPVLATISEAKADPSLPVTPFIFNHVIAAIALKESLGYPAEVVTPAGRFLLVDPTSQLTPMGWLSSAHRGRKVMICLPDRAVWVAVPEAAIQPESMEIAVRGRVDGAGALEGTATIKECGDGGSLRSYALMGKPKAFQERLMRTLDLPAEVELEVVRQSDPLDVGQPFVAEVKLRHPRGLVHRYGEWQLAPLGVPAAPAVAQKPGKPRVYPLDFKAEGPWTLKLDLELPAGLAPRVPERAVATPFRTAAWHGRVAGTHFQGELKCEERTAFYDFKHREEGVKAAKADRASMRSLLDDALTLVGPKP